MNRFLLRLLTGCGCTVYSLGRWDLCINRPYGSPCCPKYFNRRSGVATYISWISNWV